MGLNNEKFLLSNWYMLFLATVSIAIDRKLDLHTFFYPAGFLYALSWLIEKYDLDRKINPLNFLLWFVLVPGMAFFFATKLPH